MSIKRVMICYYKSFHARARFLYLLFIKAEEALSMYFPKVSTCSRTFLVLHVPNKVSYGFKNELFRQKTFI